MSIVCGSDFSEHSRKAVDAAACLAARMNVPLHLVHAVDFGAAEQAEDSARDGLARAARQLLLEKQRIAALGVDVQTHAGQGAPDEVLLGVAARSSAKLIVVAALGQRAPGKWQLGSHADRLAQVAHVPVLIVRDAQAFEQWASGKRPLRVLLGADFSPGTEQALRWVSSLRALGPCEISALHLYWPPDQFERLGLSGVRDYAGPHAEVVQTLQARFASRFGEIVQGMPVSWSVQPHIGRVADRLAKHAVDEQADLLVVGSHARDPLGRIIEGSVSAGVLHCAQLSVACVPAPSQPAVARSPRIDNVLVATDFSDTGNAAIALGYALVAPHGTVHLVHVVEDRAHGSIAPRDIFVPDAVIQASEPHAGARRRLQELVPASAAGRVSSLVHVLESGAPADAIAQAAERLDSDLICVGTHGRGGVARVLLGSVAQGVLQHTTRPVLFARNPKS